MAVRGCRLFAARSVVPWGSRRPDVARLHERCSGPAERLRSPSAWPESRTGRPARSAARTGRTPRAPGRPSPSPAPGSSPMPPAAAARRRPDAARRRRRRCSGRSGWAPVDRAVQVWGAVVAFVVGADHRAVDELAPDLLIVWMARTSIASSFPRIAPSSSSTFAIRRSATGWCSSPRRSRCVSSIPGSTVDLKVGVDTAPSTASTLGAPTWAARCRRAS